MYYPSHIEYATKEVNMNDGLDDFLADNSRMAAWKKIRNRMTQVEQALDSGRTIQELADLLKVSRSAAQKALTKARASTRPESSEQAQTQAQASSSDGNNIMRQTNIPRSIETEALPEGIKATEKKTNAAFDRLMNKGE